MGAEILRKKRERLQQEYNVCNQEWEMRSEKLQALRIDFAIRSGAAAKFELKKQIEAEESRCEELSQKMSDLEAEIERIDHQLQENTSQADRAGSQRAETSRKISDLSRDDRKKFIDLLKDLPAMKSARSRRLLLDDAGLGKLADDLDISGTTAEAASEIVTFFASYGSCAVETDGPEKEALGWLLLEVRDRVGIEKREAIDGLLAKYGITLS